MSVTTEVLRCIQNSVTDYLENTDHLIYSLDGNKLEPIILNMFHLIGIKPSVGNVSEVLKQVKTVMENNFNKEVEQLKYGIKCLESDEERIQDSIKDRKKQLNDLLKRNKKPRKKK